MKSLLKAVFLNKKHFILLIGTVIAMFMLTVGSQLEMLSLGIIAKTGPDVFTLFGQEKEGKLEPVKELSLSEVENKWDSIAKSPDGVMTVQDANLYIKNHHGTSIVQKISNFMDEKFKIHSNLKRLAFILIFVAFFKAIALFTNRYLNQLVSIRVSRDLRLNYFEHIQSLPMSFYHDYDIGSLCARASSDAGVVAQSINSMLINYIQTPFAIVSTLTACFYISWKLSCVIFVGFPVIVIPIIWMAKKIKKISKQMQKNQEGFASVILDFLSGIMTVKIFAMEDFSLKKYREQNNLMARLEEKSARYANAARPILHSVSSIFFAMTILAGLYLFRLDPAELLVFCGLLYVFYEPVKKFAEENNNVFRGVAAAERMYEVLDIQSSMVDKPDAEEMVQFDNGIEFKNVSFKYRDDWVLKDLSFSVKKGQTVALVGPTGAGKSTIAKLLPRLYDIQDGEILIDGKSIKGYTQKSLKENIAFVPQKPFLFFDTVHANISFGRSFSHDQICAAAKSAHAEEFIVNLPGQYNCQLEDAGKNLSGGQQQRLAIARALVKNAPILVMDEATSSLDAVSEEKIKEAIVQLHGKLTQIIIAHRFSTIEHADKIIYLEKGRKIAEGTRDELLKSCPNFKHMWELMYTQAS